MKTTKNFCDSFLHKCRQWRTFGMLHSDIVSKPISNALWRPNFRNTVLRSQRHPKLLRFWKSKIDVGIHMRDWVILRDISGSLIPTTTPWRERKWNKRNTWRHAVFATFMLYVCNLWSAWLVWRYRNQPLPDIFRVPNNDPDYVSWHSGTTLPCAGCYEIIAVWRDRIEAVRAEKDIHGQLYWQEIHTPFTPEPRDGETERPLWWTDRAEFLHQGNWTYWSGKSLDKPRLSGNHGFCATTTDLGRFQILFYDEDGWRVPSTGERVNTPFYWLELPLYFGIEVTTPCDETSRSV